MKSSISVFNSDKSLFPSFLLDTLSLSFLWFTWYPAKTITDTDYGDDIAILANAPAQAETLLHSLEQAATGIGLHVNAHKTE